MRREVSRINDKRAVVHLANPHRSEESQRTPGWSRMTSPNSSPRRTSMPPDSASIVVAAAYEQVWITACLCLIRVAGKTADLGRHLITDFTRSEFPRQINYIRRQRIFVPALRRHVPSLRKIVTEFTKNHLGKTLRAKF